jgi:hypothetical protein
MTRIMVDGGIRRRMSTTRRMALSLRAMKTKCRRMMTRTRTTGSLKRRERAAGTGRARRRVRSGIGTGLMREMTTTFVANVPRAKRRRVVEDEDDE